MKFSSVYDEFFVIFECCMQNTYYTFCIFLFFMYLHGLSPIMSLSLNFRSVECVTYV